MSDQEILTKAIQKAVDCGWAEDKTWTKQKDPAAIALATLHYKVIIFDHDFAKALWGEKRIKGAMLASPNETHYITNPLAAVREYKLNEDYGWHRAWELHLQQMVVADDPIKYLGENI